MQEEEVRVMADNEIIFAVEESPEGGYEAHALGHSIFTEAESLDEALEIAARIPSARYGSIEIRPVVEH